jgi:hypothetical protein
MAELGDRIIAAWRHAEVDLGVTFATPWHVLTLDHRRVTYLGLVRGFGGNTGTLIRILNLGELSIYEETDRDLHVAKLGDRHAVYDRLVFRGTLLEWGYTGPPSQRPAWVPAPLTSPPETVVPASARTTPPAR